MTKCDVRSWVCGSALLAITALPACQNQATKAELEETIESSKPKIGAEFENYSTLPALLMAKPGFTDVRATALISSSDKLLQSPGFVFGGSADGAGLLRNDDGSYSMIVNHEDNYAVSRVTLDPSFRPIRGEYILNSTGGTWRLCSATLATPEEHGFGPAYLTCGESGPESRTHAVNPLEITYNAASSKELPAFGRWSAENALPLPKQAYGGKTVVLIGDDDSGPAGGQVAMYVGERGDLANGKVYVMRRPDGNYKERDMVTGTSYDVEFAEIENAASLTGAQMNSKSVELNSIRFGRVEDLDYGKGNAVKNREIYFNVTGQDNRGSNADYSRTKYGRVYRLVLDPGNPLKGKLEVILDGDDRNGPARTFQNPDNITVTENYAYIKEDPNGYGDETHDAYIYQYDLATGQLRVAFELNHFRDTQLGAELGTNEGPGRAFGEWEFGALIDISKTVGKPNVFMVCIQPHTWRKPEFAGVDGGTRRPNENQGSQIVILEGLAK